jgi:hypothetical protein
MSINQRNVINLDINTSPQFEDNAERTLSINHGDLTQLGLERGRLKTLLHLPANSAIVLEFKGSAKSKFWKNFFTIPNTATDESMIRCVVDTTPLKNQFLGVDKAAHDANIALLQKSLDPEVLVKHGDIINSDRVGKAIRSIENKVPVASGRISAAINENLPTNPRLMSFLVNEEIIESETKTVTDETAVDPASVRSLTPDQLFFIRNALGALDDQTRDAFDIIEFSITYPALSKDESFGDHPYVRDAYVTARAELMARSFKPPQAVLDIFRRDSNAGIIRAVTALITGEQSTPLLLKEGMQAVFGEFLIYFISLKQIVPTVPERAREFAMSRMLIVRHGLFIDSKEVSDLHVKSALEIPATELQEFESQYSAPERYYACMYASVISFLKSGHHATAANLDNTVMRVLGALGININLDMARNLIPTAVYNGPHVGSMRLQYAYLLYKNATEKVTNAIAYRLHPNPPGAAPYCNLEIFIDALNAAKFFDFLDRNAEYNTFKSLMREIRRTMYYAAPYSNYLFGKSVEDPSNIKSEAAKMASYATAIQGVLPGTTLLLSPSLMKLAQLQGVNDISSNLLVNAYVTGFTRYFKHTIESNMARKYGVRRDEIRL